MSTSPLPPQARRWLTALWRKHPEITIAEATRLWNGRN
jgi:hypothetical protein